MTSSAQVDRFVHERLPGPQQMPALRFDAPELQFAPQLNLVEELLPHLAGFEGVGRDRP